MENNSQIQILSSENSIFNSIFEKYDITIYGTPEQPLFLAKQIGEILEIKDIKNTIRNYEIGVEKLRVLIQHPHPKSNDCNNKINIQHNALTEYGLYRLLFSSHVELAKKFRHFVYELLHGLRTNKYQLLKNEFETYKKSIENNKIDGVIYMITNKITNEYYIGSTIQSPYKRWYQHRKTHNYSKFSKNIHKYGWMNFELKIHSSHKVINEKELRLIERDVRTEMKKNTTLSKLMLNQRR
jgi:prophage antirepressor-like protein